jgi:hypothetical protein
MFHNRMFMKQEPKEQLVKDLKVRLERVLGLLDRKLSDQPFMAGEVSRETSRNMNEVANMYRLLLWLTSFTSLTCIT